MGDQEKEDLRDFVEKKFTSQNKRLNWTMGILITIALSLSTIFITYIERSGREDATQSADITHLMDMHKGTLLKADGMIESIQTLNITGILNQEEIKDIIKILDDIIKRIENAEFAVLTDDPSKITNRGVTANSF